VAGFQPSAADLDYPGKLQRLAQAAAPGGAAAAAGREGADAAQQPDERAPLAQDGGASEDAQMSVWRPTLRCTARWCTQSAPAHPRTGAADQQVERRIRRGAGAQRGARASARRRSASLSQACLSRLPCRKVGQPRPTGGASPERRARARAARERAGRARGLVPAGAAHAGLPVAAVPLRGAPRVCRAGAGRGGLLRRRRAGAHADTPAYGMAEVEPPCPGPASSSPCPSMGCMQDR